jgi:magnesium chelatase subunit H
MKRIVAIAGFESFNANLYRQAGEMAMGRFEGLEVIFFSDLFVCLMLIRQAQYEV